MPFRVKSNRLQVGVLTSFYRLERGILRIMTEGERTIQVSREGIVRDATVAWRFDRTSWIVEIVSAGFGTAQARADDAFEALCLIREELEPFGWRIGVAGAQADVWPSGMARDQGGGQRAYRMTTEQVGDLVDTFEPVDPETVTTVALQRAESDRLYEAIRRSARVG
ncbi:hypothetical protein [Microbacterium sp. SD291]|uniref:hypothetical protein n=1 Tax=Microbacterium sp. SD291 TaxID=2782007 RepID=UPI0027DE3CD3|nr:hypothetical protein [Microbacterium sp. SD291]